MTEQMKKVWAELEEKIGSCCLHKKAALNELSGVKYSQLTLVTTAPNERIEAFLGNTKFEHNQERYSFTYNGVYVDLTTYVGITDVDELYRLSFCHTLTIDSVGIRFDGKKTNLYGGVEDIKHKILRMAPNNGGISEGVAKRIFSLMLTGYTVDDSVFKEFEKNKLLEKATFRKNFFEVLTSAVLSSPCPWDKVAYLLSIVGNGIEHKKAVTGYTAKLQIGTGDKRFRQAFLFLIFAMMKASSKEIAPVLRDGNNLGFYDSVCANLQKRISSYQDFSELKTKYGEEFMELLFDVQSIWMNMEGIPYHRPSEKDFDTMKILVSDERFWGDEKKITAPPQKPKGPETKPIPEKTEEDEDEPDPAPATESEEKLELEGSFDFEKAMSADKYNGEEYEESAEDEPMEGKVDDEYEIEPNDSEVITIEGKPVPSVDLPTRENRERQKNSVCIDDEVQEKPDDSGGINMDGLAEYENDMEARKQRVTSPPPPPRRSDGDVLSHSRGHTSKVLADGGN